MEELAWADPTHLVIKASRDSAKGLALYWAGPDWDGNDRPIAIAYGGVEYTKQQVSNLVRKGHAVQAGKASYIAQGCGDEVDMEGMHVVQRYWNGHPDMFSGAPEHNNWWGARVNQGTFPKNPVDQIAEVRMVDVTGILRRPNYDNHSPLCMVAWVLEGAVSYDDELEGTYNLTASSRTMKSLGYKLPETALPTTPTLGAAREAGKQEAREEREKKKRAAADTRRYMHLFTQALVAKDLKKSIKVKVNSKAEKARE
ncbi:hypothetical protein B484DRAFT_438229, partial [Ochromonadaceae sp. CCMP2298]